LKKLPAIRLIRALTFALASAAILLAAASFPWRAERPPAPPRIESEAHGAGPLRAGAAVVSLDPPAGVPVAGFPRLAWRSLGSRDPVAARALVLEEPGCRVALASVDLLLVPAALERSVAERVADLGLSAVVVAATHTHAGPGGYWDSWLGERFATGPFDRATFDRVSERVALAIRNAAASSVPARLAAARAQAPDLVWNRDGGEIDARLSALRADAVDGRPIAEVVIFPAHATLLGKVNRLISGDWPAALSADAQRGVRLFFQGAVGDQSARLTGDPSRSGPQEYGRAVAARVDALVAGTADPAPRLGVAAATVLLPRFDPAGVPALLRPAARTLLGGTFPDHAVVRAIRAGPLLIVAVPAEPVAAVGARWRMAAGPDAEVMALAGDYLGYVELPTRVLAGTGEARRTYFASDLAFRLGEAAVVAARAADGAVSLPARATDPAAPVLPRAP
jgi:hypothetical protein